VGATRIATSANGSPLVTLEVPRQANAGALIRLARTLGAQPGIALAFAAQMHAEAVLPEASPGVPVSPDAVSHLLATRFPQAWNARGAEDSGCLPRRVPVYVLDDFGPVQSSFLFLMNDGDFESSAPLASAASGHGYDVSLILAAAFDAAVPTGAVPFADCALLHPIEVAGRESQAEIEDIVAAVRAEPGHFVLNNSMGDGEPMICGPNRNERCTAANSTTAQAADLREHLMARIAEATYLAQRLGPLGAADRMLISVAAGNVVGGDDRYFFAQRYRGFRDARLGNMFVLATHLADLDGLLQDPNLWTSSDPSTPANIAFDSTALAQLHVLLSAFGSSAPLAASNLLIVDSGSPAEAADAVTPSDFDYLGANVRAVGADVPLLVGAPPVDGTSFAAPQLASLAAYLWTVSDDLAGQPTAATVAHILRTSRPAPQGGVGLLAVPLADAYQAVLALDKPGGPRKVRRALVDANDDGAFDPLDLQLFAAAYQLSNANRPTIPAARDFSRFDLNGDGYTGGIVTTAFDLDVDGLDPNGRPNLNTVDEQIEDYSIAFNEAALSDLQILCFYAYSPLYASDAGGQNDQLRTSLLGPDNCVRARLTASLPAQISASATLNATVEVPNGQGQFVAAPGLRVELTPSCATVSPSIAQTDANGAIAATVTPSSGCSSVSVQAVARAGAGTPPLAQQVVTATVPAAPGAFVVQSGFAAADQARTDSTTSTLPETLQATGQLGSSASFTVAAAGNQITWTGSTSTPLPDGQSVEAAAETLIKFIPDRALKFTATVNAGWVAGTPPPSGSANVGAQVQTSHGDAVAHYSRVAGMVNDERLTATIEVAAGDTVFIMFGAAAGAGGSGSGLGATVTFEEVP
jgi:hypothetical protein